MLPFFIHALYFLPFLELLRRKIIGIFGSFLSGTEASNRLLVEADLVGCREEAVWARCPNYESPKKK